MLNYVQKGGMNMSLTNSEFLQLQKLMDESPENKALLQKLLDSHQYTISKISHEVRNPLALLYSTFQLIEAEHPEAKSFKYWSSMREDMEFMISLLEELSSFNNSERLNTCTISTYEYLSKICLSFASSMVDTPYEFTSKIASDLPDITGDSIKLREVFMNLLKNARESLSEGGRIHFEACATDSTIQVSISDTGCGIPPEKQTQIFDAFVTYKPEGTGLGLAISQRVVSAHGGTITLTSTPGKGTTFTVALPITTP